MNQVTSADYPVANITIQKWIFKVSWFYSLKYFTCKGPYGDRGTVVPDGFFSPWMWLAFIQKIPSFFSVTSNFLIKNNEYKQRIEVKAIKNKKMNLTTINMITILFVY